MIYDHRFMNHSYLLSLSIVGSPSPLARFSYLASCVVYLGTDMLQVVKELIEHVDGKLSEVDSAGDQKSKRREDSSDSESDEVGAVNGVNVVSQRLVRTLDIKNVIL